MTLLSTMRRQWRALLAALAMGVGAEACTGDGPLPSTAQSTLSMRFLTPATVRSVVVEVTGPGISPAVVLNVSVGPDTVATGSLTLPSGSARRFVVTAVDTAGVETHRADTTITLQPGTNPSLMMRLEPLASSMGITVTFGGIRLVVPDTSTRVLGIGDSTVIQAYAIRANGDTVPRDSLLWGSSNPAVATAEAVVIGRRLGAATLSVSHRGAAALIGVRVVDSYPSCRQLLASNPSLPSGRYSIRPAPASAPSRTVLVYCDMQTDGGGWTKILGHSVSDGVARPNPTDSLWSGLRLAAVDSGSVRADHVLPLRSESGATELRFLCEKPSTGRRLHIKTSAPQVLDFLFGVTNSRPATSGTFVRLSDDSSNLAQQPERWGGTPGGAWGWIFPLDPGDRLIDHPFMIVSERHWMIVQDAAGAIRNECDDFLPGSSPDGVWSVWIR